MIPIRYNVRSLFVRKTTTIATLLGIGLVVFVLASSQMLAHGIQRTMGRSGDPNNAIILRQGSDAELTSSVENRAVSLVEGIPGVARSRSGAPLVVGELVVVIAADLKNDPGQVANVLVRGVPDDVKELRSEMKVVEGRPAKPGTNEVVVGKRVTGRFKGVELGGSFDLNKNRPVTVVGVFEANGSAFESEVWADIETVRGAFGREGLVASVTARLESRDRFESFKANVEHDKQLGLAVMREDEFYEKQSQGTSLFIGAMGSVIVFFFSLGAMIGAMITMYAAVANRMREIGTLRALGFSRGAVLFSFLLEAVILAVLGGILGVGASMAMTLVHFSMMNFASWSEITFSFEPTVPIVVTAVLVGGMMGVLGGFFPALRAARLSPLEAMRD